MALWRFDEILKDVEAPTTIRTFGGNDAWNLLGDKTAELVATDGSGKSERFRGTIAPDGGAVRVKTVSSDGGEWERLRAIDGLLPDPLPGQGVLSLDIEPLGVNGDTE